VLPKVDHLGRREGWLVDHMVDVTKEVSPRSRSRKILVYGANISKIRNNK
jgi:hypothetical protein